MYAETGSVFVRATRWHGFVFARLRALLVQLKALPALCFLPRNM